MLHPCKHEPLLSPGCYLVFQFPTYFMVAIVFSKIKLFTQILFHRLCCVWALPKIWLLRMLRTVWIFRGFRHFSLILHLPPQLSSWVNAAFLSFSFNIPPRSQLAKWNRKPGEQMGDMCVHVVYEHKFKQLPFLFYLMDKKLKPTQNHSNSCIYLLFLLSSVTKIPSTL